jgi:hypothetical protein
VVERRVTRSAAWGFALAAVLIAATAVYVARITPGAADKAAADASAVRPVWTEVKWPFPIDQWGTGRAFVCKAADCGGEARLYLRAKLGSCNCETGIAEDADLDRMSDFDLIGVEATPLGGGMPIAVGTMKGRSRGYALTARNPPGKSALSIAFNDRCDMIVATAVLANERPAAIAPGVMAFLNSAPVLRWAEIAIGM